MPNIIGSKQNAKRGVYINSFFQRKFGFKIGYPIDNYIYQWGKVTLFLPLLLGFLIYVYVIRSGREFVLEPFETARVDFSTTTSTETQGTRYRFVLSLSDGNKVQVSTADLRLATTIVDTACLQVRRYIDNGALRYHLVDPKFCAMPKVPPE